MKLKELQEKRGSLMKQVREILDFVGTQQRSLTADEETKIRAMEVDIDGLTASIDAEVRQMQREGAARSTPVLNAGEQRDVNTFDFNKVLNHLYRSAKGGATVIDGIEAEMIREGETEARSAGISAGGILLPRLLVRRENRDMTASGTTTTTGDQGGMTVPVEKRGLLDDFFNSSVMRLAGATVLEGLTGNLDLPRIVAGTAAAGKAENGTSDEVSPTTAMLQLTPKRLPAYIDISERLLLQSSVAIETILRGHLATQMGATQEAAFFHGTGTNEANGIAAAVTTSGNIHAGGTNGLAPTLAGLIAIETLVDTNNALLGNLHYVSNGQIRGKLKGTPKVSSTDSRMLLDSDGLVNGYTPLFTNAVSRTLTKGTSSLASAIFFGNFADYVVGYWGGVSLEMVRDKTNAITGIYSLVASTYYDGGVVRPKSFSAQLDALGA
jgi:HK97 family phage major capsid protein